MQEKREKLSRKVCKAFAPAGVTLQPIPATPAISAYYQASEPPSYFEHCASLGLISIEVGGMLGWGVLHMEVWTDPGAGRNYENATADVS